MSEPAVACPRSTSCGEARSARDVAAAELTTALRPLRATPGVEVRAEDDQVSSDALSEMLDAARRRGAQLEALVPREEAATVARAEQQRDELRLRRAEQTLERVDLRAAELPADIQRAARALAEATAAAAREEALTLSLEAARQRQLAVTELLSVHGGLVEAQDAHRDARDRVQDAREHVQDLMARRLAGMAAELAGALEPGTPCPVCGGADHPHPAEASTDPVTAADQESAERALAMRAADLEAVGATLRDVQTRQQVLTAAAEGATPAEALEAVTGLESQLAAAADARGRIEPSQQRLDALHDERDSLAQRRTAAAAQVAALSQAATTHARTAEAAEVEIASALGGDAAVTVAAAATATSRAVAGLEAALRARSALDAAAPARPRAHRAGRLGGPRARLRLRCRCGGRSATRRRAHRPDGAAATASRCGGPRPRCSRRGPGVCRGGGGRPRARRPGSAGGRAVRGGGRRGSGRPRAGRPRRAAERADPAARAAAGGARRLGAPA